MRWGWEGGDAPACPWWGFSTLGGGGGNSVWLLGNPGLRT